MSNIVINLAAEYTGKAAFTKAEKSVSSLDKAVNKLGKRLAGLFALSKVTAFGKSSFDAFMADEKAATMLANSVKNLGLAMEAPAIENFVQTLSKSAAVSDDELRPALQKLLTTTGSVAKSQQMLSDAINISRGSGVDLVTVAQDLSNAYVGNTKGLKKYNLGLTQAELKASTFLDIQTKLNKQFSGANAAYLETYAGKMQMVTVAATEAKEIIGQGLVDALILAGGKSSNIDTITNSFQGLADTVANAARGIGVIIGYFDTLNQKLTGGLLGKFIGKGLSSSPFGKLVNLGKNAAPFVDDPNSLQARQKVAYEGAAARKAAEAAAAKRNKELAAAIKKQTTASKALTAEQKKQAALKKAAAIFDMEQIQIIAALKNNISADERKRLELQLAIATGNVEEAKKLTYELAISQGMTVKLAESLASMPMANNPFAGWKGYLDEIELQAKRIASITGVSGITGSEDIPHGNVTPTAISSIASGGTSVGFGANGNIVVNVQGSVVSQDDLIAGILEGIQKKSLSGSPSAIGRIQGMFG